MLPMPESAGAAVVIEQYQRGAWVSAKRRRQQTPIAQQSAQRAPCRSAPRIPTIALALSPRCRDSTTKLGGREEAEGMGGPAESGAVGGSAFRHADAAGTPAAPLRLDCRHNTASAFLAAGAG